MNVVDVMTKDPVTITPDATLREALALMEDHGFKHLPVVSSGKHLVGVLTDRDCRLALNSPYVLRERWQDEDLVNSIHVRAMMTPAPMVVEPNTSAAEAARLMLAQHVGCLPVMRAETLVGIVTRSDILIAFISFHKRVEFLSRPDCET
jgi:acetoin utilization protein AcuB